MSTGTSLSRWLSVPIVVLLWVAAASAAQVAPSPEAVRIRLGGYEFDPLQMSGVVPESLRLTGADLTRRLAGPSYYLVQIAQDGAGRAEVERLKQTFGLRLAEYVPQHAYVERLTPEVRARLAQDRRVRAVVPFEPGFKISPAIGRVKHRNPERLAMPGLFLDVILQADANPQDLEHQLAALGARDLRLYDERARGGVARMRLVVGSADLVPVIARLDGVRWIEEVPEIDEDNVGAASTLQSGANNNASVWGQGLHGEGQIIGHFEGGDVDLNHCFFQDPVIAAPGLAHRKVVANLNPSGSVGGHSTFTAGNAVGDDFNNLGGDARRGGAWAARMVTGSTSGTTLFELLSDAAGFGAGIHTNSWHDNTAGAGNPATYNQTAADVDTISWNDEDTLVFGSMGNNGEEQGPPGTAKNAVGVSATLADPNEGTIGDGNAGPTQDGRRKPDLAAPGCSINSATVSTACATGPRAACATSYATPHAAAAAALVRQYFMEGFYPNGVRQVHNGFTPSGALLKATLIDSAIDMAGEAGYPSTTEGWGVVRLDDALYFAGEARNLRVWDTRNADGLFTGETAPLFVTVQSSAEPLRVTLVWTDPPAAAGANPASVNDLDLRVTSPDGTQTFLGNVFNGGVSVTGGATDTTNNVESVLVTAPAPGTWRIDVVATAVNVGNPGQGYAVVANGDFTEPPPPTGTQNLLVVRAKFADIAIEPPLPNLQSKLVEVAAYFDANAYGQVSLVPDYRGPIALDHARAWYASADRTPLIDLAQEVIGKLVAAEPGVFAGADPVDPADDIDRILIVTNDQDFTGDWATTGGWPYDLPAGLTRPLSVSIQGYDNSVARFSHGLAHQFGLVDLYAHDHVVFAKPHADGWDNMAKPITGVHSLAWSKELATWLSAHGDEILFVPRPGPGQIWGDDPGELSTIPLHVLTSTAVDRKAIAIGLTPGVTSLADEDVFYFVEARDASAAGGYDAGLPGSGVLIYYVNEKIRQGEGPVQLLDADPGTVTLADAAFAVGQSRSIPGTGISVSVLAGTAGADYTINLAYDPPESDNDVNIVAGETVGGDFVPWYSPDIWVDSLKDGFDEQQGRTPQDRGEAPVTDETNRLYARVHNPGPGDAFDFDVFFRVSEPYHTVGGQADFDSFLGKVHVERLNAGQDWTGFVEWTPSDDGEPHSCVNLTIPDVFNDVNAFNNAAQHNLTEVQSVTGSPYQPVTYRYDLTNPFQAPALAVFRAEGVPPGWTATLAPRQTFLAVGQRVDGSLTLQPPEGAPACQAFRIAVTSWTPQGDTLVPIGGGVVQVDLRNRTKMTLEVGNRPCGRPAGTVDIARGQSNTGALAAQLPGKDGCGVITAEGCTDPVRPNEEIVVKFTDPSGNPVYHTVTTDANGCFEDSYTVTEGGAWTVTAEYPGNDCAGSVVGVGEVTLPIPSDGDQDNDGVPDREEPQGDIDGDQVPNQVDPDSDGDGRPDGQDPTPWGGGATGTSPGQPGSACCRPVWSILAAILLIVLGILLHRRWLLLLGLAALVAIATLLLACCPQGWKLALLVLIVAIVIALRAGDREA